MSVFPHHLQELYHEGLNGLLDLSMERLGRPAETRRSGGRCARDACGLPNVTGPDFDPKARSRALDRLWKHPELVDEFVQGPACEEHPGLRRVVSPWRHVVQDTFVCVDACPGYGLYLNTERLFVVLPISGKATACLRGVPCLVRLTLLPFAGRIVTDGRVVHLSDQPSAEGTALITQQLEDVTRIAPIESSEDLVAYATAHRRARA